jgi:hypothetical protein
VRNRILLLATLILAGCLLTVSRDGAARKPDPVCIAAYATPYAIEARRATAEYPDGSVLEVFVGQDVYEACL